MTNAFGDFPVYAQGNIVGSVNVSQNGLMTVFDCTCDYKSRDVLRLAAVCGGDYVPLGVIMPLGGKMPDGGGQPSGALRLKKSFSRNALESLGYRDARSFHLIRQGETYTLSPEITAMPDPVQLSSEEMYQDEPDPTSYIYAYPEPPAAAEEPEQVPAPVEPWLVQDTEQETAALPAEPETERELCAVPIGVEAEQEPFARNAGLDAVPASASQEETFAAEDDNNSCEPPPDEPPVKNEPAETHENPAFANGAASFIPEGWMHVSTPGVLFNDASIAGACEGVSGALISVREGFQHLAVPVSPEEPFPMMAVFCFGSPTVISGREYIVFKIQDGNLTL